MLKTYQDSAIETYRLSKQNSRTQEATTIDKYYGAMWNKLNIDNLKERIDVRLIIQYLDETFLVSFILSFTMLFLSFLKNVLH